MEGAQFKFVLFWWVNGLHQDSEFGLLLKGLLLVSVIFNRNGNLIETTLHLDL